MDQRSPPHRHGAFCELIHVDIKKLGRLDQMRRRSSAVIYSWSLRILPVRRTCPGQFLRSDLLWVAPASATLYAWASERA